MDVIGLGWHYRRPKSIIYYRDSQFFKLQTSFMPRIRAGRGSLAIAALHLSVRLFHFDGCFYGLHGEVRFPWRAPRLDPNLEALTSPHATSSPCSLTDNRPG